jgi:hypothetical protein
VSAVSGQVEIPVTGRSLVQRSPTDCGVSECDQGNSYSRSTPYRPSSHERNSIIRNVLPPKHVVLCIQNQIIMKPLEDP